MIFLRQSTAGQEVPLGRFVDSTDGNTAETGLTIANTDIKIWKKDATALVDKNSGGATHMAGGEYYAVFDATDTDTIGPMKIAIHVSGALYVQVFCTVLDEAVYDVLFGTVALATATNITAGTITTATNLTNLPAITSNWLTAAGIAASALNGKGDWNIGKTGYALTSGERDSVADALLARNIAGGSSTGRTVKQAMYFLRNKWTAAAGTLTVYETDDTTSSWTSALTGTAGADPITATDPA